MGERYYKNFFLPILVFCLLSFNVLADEIKSELLDAASKRISDILSTLPGEGITEVDVQLVAIVQQHLFRQKLRPLQITSNNLLIFH